jgi:Tol biopolymer transport system component
MSWSPDGKQIMLVVDRPGLSHPSLFVMSVDATGLTQLTRTVNVHGGSWGTHP